MYQGNMGHLKTNNVTIVNEDKGIVDILNDYIADQVHKEKGFAVQQTSCYLMLDWEIKITKITEDKISVMQSVIEV